MTNIKTNKNNLETKKHWTKQKQYHNWQTSLLKLLFVRKARISELFGQLNDLVDVEAEFNIFACEIENGFANTVWTTGCKISANCPPRGALGQCYDDVEIIFGHELAENGFEGLDVGGPCPSLAMLQSPVVTDCANVIVEHHLIVVGVLYIVVVPVRLEITYSNAVQHSCSHYNLKLKRLAWFY